MPSYKPKLRCPYCQSDRMTTTGALTRGTSQADGRPWTDCGLTEYLCRRCACPVWLPPFPVLRQTDADLALWDKRMGRLAADEKGRVPDASADGRAGRIKL